jgi:DNA-binding response OmpR family regulator
MGERPRQDSNLRHRLRRPVLYPLSYEGGTGPLYDGDMAPSTVLVVDDDPVIVKLLQVNFEMEGYDVITAGDGQEGLDRARADRPDAIVLDVMMPKLNGLQVAEMLKADEATRSIPIILLSAKAQSTDIAAGKEIADEYMTKPFDPLELLDRVADLLKRRPA